MSAVKERLPVVPAVNLDDWETQIGKIESTMLGREDHGIFTFVLTFNLGGFGQGAGLFCLDEPSTTWAAEERRVTWGEGYYQVAERVGTSAGLTLIMAVLDACGIEKWEDLPGRTLFVLRDKGDTWGTIRGLAPLPTESGRPLIFKDVFARYPSNGGSSRDPSREVGFRGSD